MNLPSVDENRYEPVDVLVAGGGMAGIAAAAKTSPRDIDVQALRQKLRSDHVLLEPKPDPITEEK